MVIALDYGEKKTGFAYSDETENFAFAGQLITGYKNVESLLTALDKLVAKHSPTAIVIGDPTYKGENRNMISIQKVVDHYVEQGIKTVLINEFYTSEIAKVNLKEIKNKNIDSESARQILQEYLDTLKS